MIDVPVSENVACFNFFVLPRYVSVDLNILLKNIRATDDASTEIVVITKITFTSAKDVKPKIKKMHESAIVGASDMNKNSDCGKVIHFLIMRSIFF